MKNANPQEIYERLTKLAKEAGVSFGEFCDDIGMSIYAFYRWRTKVPGRVALMDAADYFGVSIDWLLYGTDPLEDVRELMCDRYCKWPEKVESAEELEERCRFCPLTQEG